MSMDDLRGKLRVDATGAVNVVFYVEEYSPDGGVKAIFDCLTCDRGLEWTGKFNRYQCPECEIELTAQEAVDLCDKYHKLLEQLASDSGKKKSIWQRMFK